MRDIDLSTPATGVFPPWVGRTTRRIGLIVASGLLSLALAILTVGLLSGHSDGYAHASAERPPQALALAQAPSPPSKKPRSTDIPHDRPTAPR